jgi:hypothetical protein
VNSTVQQLLESFDALPEADKHRAALEILRRVSAAGAGDIPESALVEAADKLFRTLDAEEASPPETSPDAWRQGTLKTAGKWQGEFERPG